MPDYPSFMFEEGNDPRDKEQGPSPATGAPIGGAPLMPKPMGPPEAPLTVTPPPTTEEMIGAAARENNLLFAGISALARAVPATPLDPNFNALDYLKKAAPDLVENYSNSVAGMERQSDIDNLIGDVRQHQSDSATLSASGPAGYAASIALGLADPIWAIPIFGEAMKAESVLGTAARFAAGGAALSAADQAGLNVLQGKIRPDVQDFTNVSTNALLMGIMGGAFRFLSPAEHAATEASLEAARPRIEPQLDENGNMQLVNHGPAAIESIVAATASAGGHIGEGPSHMQAVEKLPEHLREGYVDFGFRTSTGRIVDSREAGQIAATAKQIKQREGYEPKAWITSEDLPSLAGSRRELADLGRQGPAPAGAQVADQRTLKPISFGLDKIPGIGKLFRVLSPNTGVYFTSPSIWTRRTQAELAETALGMTTDKDGMVRTANAAPVLESQARVLTRRYEVAMLNAIDKNWVKHYYGETPPNKAVLSLAKEGINAPTVGNKLSYLDFNYAMDDAGRNGDVHPIPEVQTAAQELRRNVYDPIKEQLQKTKDANGNPMLGELLSPPKGDKSFLPRTYLRKPAVAQQGIWVDKIADWLRREQEANAATKERIGALNDRHTALLDEIDRLTTGGRAEDEARLAEAAIERDQVRSKLEEEIGKWRGNSSREAVAALKARGEAEAERGARMEAGEYEGRGERLRSADRPVDRAVKRMLDADVDKSPQELRSRAQEIFNRIIGSPDGRIPYDLMSGGPKIQGFSQKQDLRGSLNERTFAMPSSELAGIINKNVSQTTAAYLRTVIPDMLLTERFGDVDMTDAFRRIEEEYNNLSDKMDAGVAKASEGKSADEIAKLTAKADADRTKLYNQRDWDIKTLAAERDIFRHVYGWDPRPGARTYTAAIRDLQNWAAISSLGTSVFNRATDLVNAVYRFGFMNVFRDSWQPLMQGPTGKLVGEIREQARDAGVGTDGLLGHVMHNLYDVVSEDLPGNKFSRFLSWATNKSMVINAHAFWTDVTKAMVWNIAQGGYYRAAKKLAVGTASPREMAFMAEANITPSIAQKIVEQYDKFSTVVKDRRFANTGDWTDQQAKELFDAAMSREANISVLTAGLGDKPTVMSRPLGALILQFHSFTAAATEKIMISNLQRRDAFALQGLIGSVAMGMLGYRLYALASGQGVSSNPADWIKEGIARSAMTGWLSDANLLSSKFTSGLVDYNRLYGATMPDTRHADLSVADEVLGPTWSRLEGLAKIPYHVAQGRPSSADVHQVRLSLFLQNLMFVRRALDEVENSVDSAFGFKPRPLGGVPGQPAQPQP